MKWFHDVVISTRFQAVHLVLPPISRRQDQDRVGFSLLTNLANQIQPRHLGKAEVDNRKINRKFERKVEPFFAIRRFFYRIPGLAELLGQ